MPISVSNKPQFTGIIILFVGVALLAFTFINAFLFLQEPFGIIATGDLALVFGEALAPLIQACIRLMYLGIMGWIGSLLTVRGIPLVTHKHVPIAPPVITTQAPTQPEPQPKPIAPPQQQPQPKPAPTPAPAPTPSQTPQPQPQPQPQPAPQQTKPEAPTQPSAPQVQTPQPTPQPKKEEPEAILIPPENQREE